MIAAGGTTGPLTGLDRTYPDLLRLAQIVALAARVEPQVVRQARLVLLPWTEAGLEADLWFSPLVQARSTLALVLLPEVLPALRSGLAADQALLRRAWREVLTQVHPAVQTPPLILLEEELIYQGLLENDPAASLQISALLQQAMKTMQDDKERGPALALWALRTYPRLPARVQQSQDGPNFQALAAYTAGRLGNATLQGVDGAGAGQITITTTDPVEVWVRLLDTGVELSRAPLDGGNPVPTQRFDTIWVEVGWDEGSEARAQAVIVPPSDSVQVAAPPGVFRIRTVAGDVYTLRPQGGRVTGAAQPAAYHALLIGIDAYPNRFPALQGCANDVAAMAAVLSDLAGFGLPPEQMHITRLVAPAAPTAPSPVQAAPLEAGSVPTRANLLAELDRLGGADVRSGDRVLVYFAGYGTQGMRGGAAQDALVTADGQLVYAAEGNERLAAIAARTDDVTVILDCGFSGGARGDDIADSRLRSRFLARAAALGPPPPTGPAAGSGRILQGAVTSRVVLLASRTHEPAYETTATGTPNGVLTAALTAILRAVEPPQRPTLRWADILPDLSYRVTTQVPAQYPLLAGYLERRVFGGPWTRHDPGFAVRQNADGSFQIAAGSLVGVREGAIIALYGPNPAVFPPLGSQDDIAARLGELRVVTAAPATALAVPVSSGPPPTLPPGARARLAEPGVGERLRVRLVPPDDALAAFLSRSGALHVTGEPSEAEVTVRGTSDQGWTISNDVEPEVARVPPHQQDVLQEALQAYALCNTVLRLAENSNDPQLAGALDVTLLDANDPQALADIAPDPAGIAQAGAAALPEAPRDERGIFRLPPMFRFCVRISNAATDPLFFAALNCTNTGRVEYLGDGMAAPSESVLLWQASRVGQPFVPTLSRGSSREIDRLVVVATTQAGVDLRFLTVERSVQEVIDQESYTRGAVGALREAPQAGVGAAGLWTTVTVPWLIAETPAAPTPPPLEIRGVNYFPAQHPWERMWTEWDPRAIARELDLAARLGCNTLRTFLPFALLEAGPAADRSMKAAAPAPPDPQTILGRVDQFLELARSRGMRVILGLFGEADVLPALIANLDAALAHLDRVLDFQTRAGRRLGDDPRILMWDLVNELDDEAKVAPQEVLSDSLLPGFTLPLFIQPIPSAGINLQITIPRDRPGEWTPAGLAWLTAVYKHVLDKSTQQITFGVLNPFTAVEIVRQFPDPRNVPQYHEYSPYTGDERAYAASIAARMQVIQARTGRPALIGELGVPSGGVAFRLTWTEELQRKVLNLLFQAAAENADKVRGLLVRSLIDPNVARAGESAEQLQGLFHADLTPKPAAAIVQSFYQAAPSVPPAQRQI